MYLNKVKANILHLNLNIDHAILALP